jgi:hypothetical protein
MAKTSAVAIRVRLLSKLWLEVKLYKYGECANL